MNRTPFPFSYRAYANTVFHFSLKYKGTTCFGGKRNKILKKQLPHTTVNFCQLFCFPPSLTESALPAVEHFFLQFSQWKTVIIICYISPSIKACFSSLPFKCRVPKAEIPFGTIYSVSLCTTCSGKKSG